MNATKNSVIDQQITCKSCRERLETIGGQWANLREHWNCGNVGRVVMGHQLMHTTTGETALCNCQSIKTTMYEVRYVGAPYGIDEMGETISRHKTADAASAARAKLQDNPKYYGRNTRIAAVCGDRVEWHQG